MGLFGGFKAKFTKNKKEKTEKIVALNFRLNSEFESGNSSTQSINPVTYPENRKGARPKSAILRSATFEDKKRDLLEKLKSNSLSNLNEETSSNSLLRSSEALKKSSSTRDRPKAPILVEEEYIKPNSIYLGGNGSVHDYEEINDTCEDDTPSPLIMMTQHAPEESIPKVKPKTTLSSFGKVDKKSDINSKSFKRDNDITIPPYKNEDNRIKSNTTPSCDPENYFQVNTASTKNPIKTLNTDEDFQVNVASSTNPKISSPIKEEDFQVNVVHYDKSYVSEDELSYQEEESTSEYTGFSSQAAILFFGTEIETPPRRPRRFNVSENDFGEMDC